MANVFDSRLGGGEMARKEPKKVTTIQVAALAGASPSTVSRALSGDPRITDATRQRVLAAADQLGYRPNLIARSLKNKATGIIGVVVTDLGSFYHAEALRLLVDELGENGLAPLVFACHARQSADAVIARMAAYQVDAVIALAAPFDGEIVASCERSGKPLVLMNRYLGPEPVNTVGGDFTLGGSLAAEHLIACGARSFAYFGGEDGARISSDRETGFVNRLALDGFDCPTRNSSVYSYDVARKVAQTLLENPPDAIFCANDTLAFALIDAARHDEGLRIPEDLMVLGYDNTILAARPSYDLTSIDQDLPELVARTVERAQALAAAPDTIPVHDIVQPRLVARGTTKRPLTKET